MVEELNEMQFMETLRQFWSVEIPGSADSHSRLHEDLGADSLEILELSLIIESCAGDVAASINLTPSLMTLGDALNYYARLLRDTSEPLAD